MSNLCLLPFTSLEADPMGKCKVCCLSTKTIPDINLKKNTLSEAFNSDYMYGLREQFLRGEKPEECGRCWAEEDAGRKSKRQHTLDKLKNVNTDESKLVFLDLKLGNICNLKCRICGSFSSSKWASEELDIYPDNMTARQNLMNGRWPRKADAFWTDLTELLANVRYFEFTGGEPFLIDEHFTLLEIAVEMGYAKDIDIHYNTNTTTIPKRGLELWPHFKSVEIALSIDDIGPRFEYQRYGANWEKTLENLQKFRELRDANSNIILQLCLTTNVQNFYYIDEMCEWIPHQRFDYVYFNVLHDAWHFSISHLTQRAKDLIYNKYANYSGPYADEVKNLLTFMYKGMSSDGSDLVRVLKQSDVQRNQKFSDHHPEIAAAIGYE
jgi:sulfatase maturation enzyme AslB (radical SAM superfamily)